MENTFLIRCDANKKNGFGHFSRCLNLARGIREKRSEAKIVFLGDYNEVPTQLIEKYKMETHTLFDSIDDEENFSEGFDYFVLDNYLIDQDYIGRYCEASIKFIKIDDFNDLNLENVDIVVNFCVRGINFKYKSKKKCLGLDYFPVREEFKPIRLKNFNLFKDKINNILVFLGAADQHGAGFTMVQLLDQVLNDTRISLITDRELNQSYSSINNNNIHYLPLCLDMEKYLKNADAAITGGGLTKYECAYSCIPNASLTQTVEQDEEAQTFANAGLTYYLGMAESLDLRKDKVIEKLKEFQSVDVRSSSIENAKKKFITGSTQNLVDALLEN